VADRGSDDRIRVRVVSPGRPLRDALIEDVRAGFSRAPKELPPKYFYDADGSGLFEKITDLPEYYLTRAEQEVLTPVAEEWIAPGKWRCVVELGSGSSTKTRTILEAMLATGPAVYAPFDISEAALRDAAERLAADYDTLRVDGFIGDFLGTDLGVVLRDTAPPKLVAFLGSTIGNLTPPQRAALFRSFAQYSSPGDAFLLGVDLVKNADLIESAYNDDAGVTAEFNKNVLRVLRRELGANVEVDDFRHEAPYIREADRIEMRLYAERDLEISFAPSTQLPSYRMEKGEYLLTELSHKFTRAGIETELAGASLRVARWQTDPEERMALALITP
jgi:L-histidine N-alpha-methyltransferase